MKVLVIGAGSTGLLLSQGLTTAGIDCTVYERHSVESYHSSPREWAMTMHWGREFLSQAISPRLRPRLSEINCDPFQEHFDTGYPQLNGKTGEMLLLLGGSESCRISRRKLRDLLSQDINVQYDKKLTGISYEGTEVVAHFTDGTVARGDCLVGCDSAKSVVREHLVGVEKAILIDSPITIMNFTASYDAETARYLRTAHPTMIIGYHPELNNMSLLAIQDVPDPDRPETWSYQLMFTWKGEPTKEQLANPEDRMRFFKERGAQFAEPFRTAALKLNGDLIIPVDKGHYWMPIWWENHDGKVTLAGDAAHPMLPHRGQGLNNALQDAAALVDALKEVQAGERSLYQVITAYEEEMRARACEEVQTSLKQAMLAHDWERFLEAPIFKLGLKKQKKEGKERI